jgi:hypothetical protein
VLVLDFWLPNVAGAGENRELGRFLAAAIQTDIQQEPVCRADLQRSARHAQGVGGIGAGGEKEAERGGSRAHQWRNRS